MHQDWVWFNRKSKMGKPKLKFRAQPVPRSYKKLLLTFYTNKIILLSKVDTNGARHIATRSLARHP
jgi:hypothetical protein